VTRNENTREMFSTFDMSSRQKDNSRLVTHLGQLVKGRGYRYGGDNTIAAVKSSIGSISPSNTMSSFKK